jgi:mannosylglycoprotein endo-beta-mannosidase
VELHSIFADEELFWLQRSHERWLLQGDSNTSYFHRVANGRKRKSSVHSLKNGDVIIEGTKDLLEHATSYYKELFGPAPRNLVPIGDDLWTPDEKLNDEDNIDLSWPFSVDEIKTALFSMEVNRAPGPDNIPIEFFQHCWHIVQFDILNMFARFFNGTLDVQRLNYGVITLLPKVSGADKIQQYRPICLLRCLCKLITKMLTLRLDPYAKKLFSVQQNAFIKKEYY